MHEDLESLMPKTEFTRREFIVTSLTAGFALAAQPVSAQTTTTDASKGRKIPTVTWTTDLAQYEDGQRVAITNDTVEWWYFDTIMDDGSTCAVTFLRPLFESGPLAPTLQFAISPPKGKYFQQVILFSADKYSASSDSCRVTMGPNWVVGDLHNYKLHAEGDGLRADLALQGVVPGWRIGPYLPPQQAAEQGLGEQIVIPSGTVRGSLTYDGVLHKVRGTCYHDHQWGGPQTKKNTGVKATSWYWGRVRVGDHSVVFAQILGTVGSGPIVPIAALFTLARGTRMTCDIDPTALTVTPLGKSKTAPGSQLGVEVVWKSNQGMIRLELPSPKEIARYNHSKYLRFLSPAVLTSDFAGEQFSGAANAIWEINVL